MNSKLKKEIIAVSKFIYALSLLSLCISLIMTLVYVLDLGFSNLSFDIQAFALIIGVPIILITFTKIIYKKNAS